MTLKPRIATPIGMIICGGVLGFFGIRIWVSIGGNLGLGPGVFGILGLAWFLVGILVVARRRHLAITINENGIELPTGNLFHMRRVRIGGKEIGAVLKHESFKGRLIQINMTNGIGRLVQARHYCELEEFLSHCRKYGLPVA
jgi:hypothetical protein